MTKEIPDDRLPEELKKALMKHDGFEAATPANSLKDDISLGDHYRKVVELRMDRDNFWGRHTPTQIIESWSVMNGPRRLKNSIETWVDEIENPSS